MLSTYDKVSVSGKISVRTSLCLRRVIIPFKVIILVFICIGITISNFIIDIEIINITHNTPFIILHHINKIYDMLLIACKELHWSGRVTKNLTLYRINKMFFFSKLL